MPFFDGYICVQIAGMLKYMKNTRNLRVFLLCIAEGEHVYGV